MAALNDWDVTDANNNSAPPDGWPENTMQYSEVNDTGRAVQGTLKRYFADVNGSLQAGGVADAYTLTLNESGYTSYFQGMYFACEINATNTGASTINVNGIGVQNIVSRDGSALAAGTLEAGGIYEFRYDGTDFQLMGTLTSAGSVDIAQATLTNSNVVDLVDTDVALRVGAADPDTAQHVEVTLSEVQSKSNNTTAAGLDLNPLGGLVRIGGLIGSDFVQLYGNGARVFSSEIGGVAVWGSSSNDPTTGNPQDTIINMANNAGASVGFFGWNGSDTLNIRNRVHGGPITIAAEDSSGVLQNIVNGDPDDTCLIYYAGDIRVRTLQAGVRITGDSGGISEVDVLAAAGEDAVLGLRNTTQNWDILTDGTNNDELRINDVTGATTFVRMGNDGTDFINFNLDAGLMVSHREGDLQIYGRGAVPNPAITFWNSAATRIGFINQTTTNLVIQSETDSANVLIRGNDAGSVTRTLIDADPDDDVALFDAGTEVARTIPAASGGFEVNNTLTGGGFERVLTTSDIGFRGALADRTTSQSIANNTQTSIAFDAEIYDTDNIHDNVTNNTRLTVPANASYIVLYGRVNWQPNTTGRRSLFSVKNGGAFEGQPNVLACAGSCASASIGQIINSNPLSVVQNDFFEMEVTQNSGGNLNAQGQVQFGMWIVAS